ncbi:DUF3052 domain-containing protein [Flavobacteriaceae bacterium TP-CH-4]|uniref:DUF3052 domain-containing protein n=1 Tax=Pelagihabitans pacificus TaxID=2696054 RepID=A0A967AU21_9FLAO|nr:DUF3052 domain-containing protein [Pelagihabitans pacificus]NHF59008.1 DUF3052 domain-containing protein [Pelagihabitans pacificus]
MSSGYSKTPLGKKLGLKEGFKIVLYQQPENYFDLLQYWPEGIAILEDAQTESSDFIHLFCLHFEELQQVLSTYIQALKKNGSLWVSWPKGTSGIETDLNRDVIREYILKTTPLVDVKVAAVDQDWSGLKFMYRLKNR